MSQSVKTDYDCVVQFRNGKYYLRIEELGIMVFKEDLASGYEELMGKKNELIRESEESEENFPLPPPKKFSKNNDNALSQELKLFAMKTLIAGTLFVALIFLGEKKINQLASSVFDRAGHSISSTLDRVIDRAGNSIASSISSSMDKALDGVIDHAGHSISSSISSSVDEAMELPFIKAVSRGVTPEENEKIIKDMRKIVKRNKPFVDELKLLLVNDSLTPSQ